jgi:hypothetical protein
LDIAKKTVTLMSSSNCFSVPLCPSANKTKRSKATSVIQMCNYIFNFRILIFCSVFFFRKHTEPTIYYGYHLWL